MIKKRYKTHQGNIIYWVNVCHRNELTLVFLPGLTADHRLFDKQIEYFKGKVNVLVWDPPGHGESWPFEFEYHLMDKTQWLHDILKVEHIAYPVIVGQSMGGYVGQMFAELYPDELSGFVSIDSAPLQREVVTAAEIWLLKRMEPVYRYYPWKSLLKLGTNGVAVSAYGRKLMHDMLMVYEGNQQRYAKLSGHGMKLLAEGYERNLAYDIPCPAILICGEKDKTGSAIHYNKVWHRRTGIPLHWIKGAGHNANTDQPDEVNALIEKLLIEIKGK